MSFCRYSLSLFLSFSLSAHTPFLPKGCLSTLHKKNCTHPLPHYNSVQLEMSVEPISFELLRGFEPEDFELARTFSGFNSTFLLTGLAVGAVLVLLLGVGLYLYDYYATGTSRTEPLPQQDYESYAQAQYANVEQAYPAYRLGFLTFFG